MPVRAGIGAGELLLGRKDGVNLLPGCVKKGRVAGKGSISKLY